MQIYLEQQGMKDIKIHSKTKDEKKYSGWIGGSLFASLDTFSDVKVSKNIFEEYGAE